jgi:hypothetical protein
MAKKITIIIEDVPDVYPTYTPVPSFPYPPAPLYPVYKGGCSFDNWGWQRNPAAFMTCSCPKCSPQY